MQATLATSLLALVLAASPALAAAKTVAHRAFYAIKLKTGKEGTLMSADGRMAYEVGGSACEGWTINYRMVNDFKPAEGDARLVDTSSLSYEADDGSAFRYEQKEYLNNRIDGEKKIIVDREPGKEAKGAASKPKEEEFIVAADAIFPMQHQHRLMAAALAGGTRDASVVFDGGDGARTYRVITFIGPKKVSEAETKDGDGASLDKLQAWPMTIGYYSNGAPQEGETEDTPLYQVSFDMLENGVAQNIVLDYGDFSLEGKLIKFEKSKQTVCD